MTLPSSAVTRAAPWMPPPPLTDCSERLDFGGSLSGAGAASRRHVPSAHFGPAVAVAMADPFALSTRSREHREGPG